MSQKEKRKVYLEIRDFNFSPDKISEEFGLIPFWTGIQGESFEMPGRSPNPKRKYESTFWKYHSSDYSPLSFEELLDELLSDLKPIENDILRLAKSFFGQIMFVSYDGDFNPGFRIRQDQIETISRMGLQLYFDIYYLKGE